MSKKETIKIMEDHGPWQFTEDQIYKIKMQNPKAIAKFYIDNEKLIKRMACKFIRRKVDLFRDYSYLLGDLINQVYVDLPYYDFSSRIDLFSDIFKGSFAKVNDGGITAKDNTYKANRFNLEYDAPLSTTDDPNKNTSYVLDTLACTKSTEEIFFEIDEDREEKDAKIMEYLEKTMTNKKDLNKMFCQLFTDIPIKEIKGDEYEQYLQRKSKNCER